MIWAGSEKQLKCFITELTQLSTSTDLTLSPQNFTKRKQIEMLTSTINPTTQANSRTPFLTAKDKENLTQQGYPENILQKQLIKAKTSDWENQRLGRTAKEKDKNISQQVHFTETSNKNLPGINSILKKQWHRLQTNSKIVSSFTEKLRLIFRSNNNLKDLIGLTHLTHNKTNYHHYKQNNWIKLQRFSQQCNTVGSEGGGSSGHLPITLDLLIC